MSLQDYLINKPTLDNINIVLRPLTKNDVEDLLEWTPNKELYKYWGKRPGKSDLNPSLLFTNNDKKPSKSFHWGIVYKNENKVVGELWIYLIQNNRMAKVAFRVSDKYHDKKIATESLETALKFCFKNTELQRLWSDVDIRNIPSCHVLENCGFLKEGLIRQGKMVSTYCDYYLYGILKQDYLEQHV